MMSILLYGREWRSEILVIYFADSDRRGRKKIMEKKDGDPFLLHKERGNERERQGWLRSELDPRGQS